MSKYWVRLDRAEIYEIEAETDQAAVDKLKTVYYHDTNGYRRELERHFHLHDFFTAFGPWGEVEEDEDAGEMEPAAT
jgi:hypothetical protein